MVTVGAGGRLLLPAAGAGAAVGGADAPPLALALGVLTLGTATAVVPATAGVISMPLPAADVPALPCLLASLLFAPGSESPEQPLTAAITQASANDCLLRFLHIARAP
jgi:hypothetical protein